LQAKLGRALDPNIVTRTHGKDLLDKLGGSDPRPPQQTADYRRFREGLLKFDERLADKSSQRRRTPSGGAPQVPPARPRNSPSPPPRKKGLRGWFSTLLIAVANFGVLFSRWWS
jgi:hypothetical protein